MIPEFPQFKKLEFSDKADVEAFTRNYPPYSDFNFISMWSWDTKNETQLSRHGGNLIVKFLNYITSTPFYSCLGNNNVSLTMKALLKLSKEERIDVALKLIPEEVAKSVHEFLVMEDRDNFDYIYETKSLYEMKGGNFQRKRNIIKNFSKSYPNVQTKPVEIDSSDVQAQITGVVESWHLNKVAKGKENNYENEIAAMKRLFTVASQINKLGSLGCFDGDKMVGFAVNELVDSNFAINHFIKTDDRYKGISPYIMKENAAMLVTQGVSRLNFEQDLGILGLRSSKTMLHPLCFLKKYIVEPEHNVSYN